MRFLSIRLFPLLVVGLLLSEGAARADYMDWSYHWSISPAPVLTSGTGSVSQALGWGGMGSSHILAAAVTTSSSASASEPDHFHKSFALTLHIKDLGEHLSGNLTFHGLISGTLTYNSAHLTETFSTPTEMLRLGSHFYDVTLPSKITLQRPGAPYVPYYYATVHVLTVIDWPPPHYNAPTVKASAMMASVATIASAPVASAPEPSSLVLVGLGITLLGGARLRRSRRVRAAT